MPRANRYIQPGCLYPLTHSRHDRRFLFRFAVDRTDYKRRLRLALQRFRIRALAYWVTSNHTHLLVEAPTPDAISAMMQKLEGKFAEFYNWRKRRSGAFCEDRYRCTLVDGGEYAWNCMLYIDLNIVRAGVVGHPQQLKWCGFDELVGRRRRCRLPDLDTVLKWQDGMAAGDLAGEYARAIRNAIKERELKRNPIWTQSIAVSIRREADLVQHADAAGPAFGGR